MNAPRSNANPLSQDLQPARPVLSGGTGGGLLTSLIRSLLPSRGSDGRSTLQRAEPRLQSTPVEETASGERREPYLFAARNTSPGTAD
jgi:hypothetical protein